jgi:MFS family permease
MTSTAIMPGVSRAVRRRLRPLYVTAFLQGCVMWYSVEKPFQVSIGFSDQAITIATVSYIIVMAVAAVPLGILADRWSRRGVLHLATCGLVTASLLCGLSHGFWMYTAGLAAWGVFYACYAGTYDALVWDVLLEEAGSADDFEFWFGRIQRNEAAALITGAVLCIGVSRIAGLRAEFLLTIPVTCCAFVSLHLFREPVLHKAAASGLGAHVSQVFRSLAAKDIGWIAACLGCNLVAKLLIFEFMQLWLLPERLPDWVFSTGFAIVCAGSLAAGHYGGRLRRSAAPVAGLMVLAASSGLFARIPVVIIAAQALAITGIIALQAVLYSCLHKTITDSRIRAGTSSVVSTASMVAFVPVALGFGAVADGHGVFTASWFAVAPIAGMGITLVVITLRGAGRHRRVRVPARKATVSVSHHSARSGSPLAQPAMPAVPPPRSAGSASADRTHVKFSGKGAQMPLPFLRSQRCSKAGYETWLRIAGPDTAGPRPWSEMDDDERLVWEEVARAVVCAWTKPPETHIAQTTTRMPMTAERTG